MNRKNYQLNFIWLMVLSILLMPLIIYAGDLYHCSDNKGNEAIMDFPVDGMNCKVVESFEEDTVVKKENKAAAQANNNITAVSVSSNQVLVPVTFVYDGTEVKATLLMDTGASGTVIHNDVADRLYIKMSKTRKVKGGVVGGGIVDVHVVKMDMIKIGPHEIRDHNIGIVDHEGYKVKFDGLLGMDILSGFSYHLDLAKQQIIWQ
jgi:predicted aspartyl protease